MNCNKLSVIGMVLSLALIGCTTTPVGTHSQTMRDGFGNAVKTDQALQVINPDAGQKDVPTATLDGQKAEQAIKTYRTDKGKAEAGGLVQDISR